MAWNLEATGSQDLLGRMFADHGTWDATYLLRRCAFVDV